MKKRNKGQVLVLVALAIFVLLGLAALGIDLGYTYSVRHELQRCADAGALAGASVFRETGLNSDDATARDLATVRATDYATRDEVSRSRLLTVLGDNVTVSFPQETNKMRVQVDVQRTVPLFFARVLGWANKAIPALAVAEAYGVCEKVRCVVPWGIPAPYTDSNGDNTYTQGEPIHWAVGDDTGAPTAKWCDDQFKSYTDWDTTTHQIRGPISGRDDYLCQGSLQVLKIGIPGNQENPGNFLGLNLQPLLGPEGCPGYKDEPMGNAGADFYYWMIEHSCDCDLKLGIDEPIALDTEPGNMVKRTITAVAPTNYYTEPSDNTYLPTSWKNDPSVPYSLMNSDPGSQWISSTNPLDPLGGKPSTGIESGRVVRIPIFDPSIDFTGRSTITPLAYVGFWIQDVVYKTVTINGKTKDLGTVVGRFVTVEGAGTYENEDCGSTVLNIRLVK